MTDAPKKNGGFVFFYLFGVLALAAAVATFGFLELFTVWQKNLFRCRSDLLRELSASADSKHPREVRRDWSAGIEPVFSVLLEKNTLAGVCAGLTRKKGKTWEAVLNEDRSLSNY